MSLYSKVTELTTNQNVALKQLFHSFKPKYTINLNELFKFLRCCTYPTPESNRQNRKVL